MNKTPDKISFNLPALDATQFRTVKRAVEKRTGMEATNLQVLRMAIKALYDKEKSK